MGLSKKQRRFIKNRWKETPPEKIAQELGITPSELLEYAKNEGLSNELRGVMSRRTFNTLFAATLVSVAAGSYLFLKSQKERETAASLTELIKPYGEVVYTAGNGNRIVYLIGQKHYNYATGANGKTETEQEKTLPEVQAQIFHIVSKLVKERNLEVIVGEGLGPGELKIDAGAKGFTPKDVGEHRKLVLGYDDAVRFFAANLKEPAYAVYEMFYPQMHTLGIDDQAEQLRIDELKQQQFNLALRITPTRQDTENPLKRREYEDAIAPLRAEIDRLNYQRSLKTVNESWAAVSQLAAREEIKNESHIVVIGSSHIREMVPEYEKRECTLYVIRPKSADLFGIR